MFAALTSAYNRVVFHASDWRSQAARLAAEFADVIVLVAPPPMLRRLVEEARDELGDGVKILPFAVTRPQSALVEAA